MAPSHRTAAGRCSRRRSANGSASPGQPALDGRQRPGAQHDLGRAAPSVPSEPTSSRHRSKPLTFFTVGPPALTTAPVGRHVAHLEHACRAPGPSRAGGARCGRRPARRPRWRPASRAGRRVWPALGEGGVEVGHGRAGPHPHGHLGRLERRRCPAGGPHLAARAGSTGPPTSHCGAARRRRRPARRRRPDLARRSAVDRRRASHPHALRDRLEVAAAAAGGQDLASGWPRRRGRTPRAAGPGRRGRRAPNSSGMRSRFSSPMPCSPDSTPPASSDARTISSPAAWTRSITPGSRASNSEQRVEVAVAGVEDVHHAEVVALGDRVRPRRSTSTSRVRGTTVSCR